MGVSHLSVLPEQGEVGGGVQEGNQRRWLRGKVGEGRDQDLKKTKEVRGIWYSSWGWYSAYENWLVPGQLCGLCHWLREGCGRRWWRFQYGCPWGEKKCKSLFNSCSNMQTYWPGLKAQDLHGRVLWLTMSVRILSPLLTLLLLLTSQNMLGFKVGSFLPICLDRSSTE